MFRPDFYAVDRGQVKGVRVIERGWPFLKFQLTPGVSLLVKDVGPKRTVMRLDQGDLFQTEGEATAELQRRPSR